MSLTNIALNSRSMNGQIVLSDGVATISEGNIDCEDINSANLSADNINTNLLNVTGKLECNSAGPYNIPISISSVTGLLIGYGHVTNSGATDFLNFQSTYTSTQGGFRFWNKSSTQTLTNLAIIDNTQTYFSSQLTGCLAENPVSANSVVNKTYVDSNFLDRTNNLTQSVNGEKTFTNNLISNSQATFNNFTPFSNVTTPTAVNHLTRKDYVDSNFLDRTNNLTQSVNGLKTFSNTTNFTGSLLSRTNIKLSEYENTASTNTITLAFPMSETIALRTTPLTSNPMTINLPLLTNNERGYVFTFNKLFDTSNATNRNFPVTFNTSGGQGIYSLYDQFGTPTTNTTLLSVEKIQCKLAVGWVGSLLYWIEQTDFSTYDRYKLTEWENATTTNTLTLTLPLPPTIALRTSAVSTMTINLPTLTALERGKIFTFVKVNSYNYDVIFNTSSGQAIYPINNLTGTPTTNTTIFPSNKKITRLAVGWFGTSTYWIEVSDYSTFDIDQNNSLYARLASPNTFTNTNTFNSFLPTSTLTPSLGTHLITKTFSDQTYINFTTDQTLASTGVKRFPSIFTTGLNVTETLGGGGNRFYINVSNTSIQFVQVNYSMSYKFFVNDSVGNQIISLQTDYNNTTINNNLVSNAITYVKEIRWRDQGAGTEQQSYLSGTEFHFVALFNNNTYRFYCRDSGSAQTYPLTINSANTTVANNLLSNGEATFNTWVNLKFRTRIYDLNSGTNYAQMYMINGNELVFGPNANGDFISFYCKDAILGQIQTFKSSALGNTSLVNLTCSSSLITNNLTSPTTTSTNNIYTNLIAGGSINIGTLSSTNVIAGNTTFSSDIITQNIFCDTALYLNDYQSLPSPITYSSILVQNSDILNFDANFLLNKFQFLVSSNAVLLLDATNTTIYNNLISNSQATFNNSNPICSVSSPTLNEHLVRKDYVDNNFVDKTNTQTGIAGDKTFTGRLYNTFVIFAKDLSWLDAQGSGGRVQAYLSATDLGFISVNVNNNRYLFNTKDGAGNPTTPLLINSASTTISNNLVSNNLTSPTTTSTNNIYTSLVSGGAINIGGSFGTNNIYGSTTFNSSSTFNVGVSFLGISSFNNGGTFTEIEQTSGSNLVIRNTTNSKKIILSTTSASTGQVDSLVINTTSCDILSPTLNLNSSSTINILSPNNLTGVINFLSTLTTATINFCSTAYTSIFNLNARLAHKGVQYMNEVKTISGTSPPALAFPLEQSWMFTSTGATQVVITLPEITASHQAGFNFIIFKTASNTNSVLFNRSGSNTIRGLNSITDVTSVTRLSGTNSVGVGFYTAEVSTGNFAWISY